MPWFWLGTWSMAGHGFGQTDQRESIATLELALKLGIRHFDSAGFYGRGQAEKLLAKALRGFPRKALFLSSKGGLQWRHNQVFHDASKIALRRELEHSLTTFGCDYLDLFSLHWVDPKVPIRESLNALQEFQAEGLIRYWGVANLTLKEIKALPLGQLIPHQIHYNPLVRNDRTLIAGYHSQRLYHCVYSPFEQGLLTPNAKGEGLGKKDIRYGNPLYHSKQVKHWLREFDHLLSKNTMPQVSLVLLWILSKKEINVVISGARTRKQLIDNIEHRQWLARFLNNKQWIALEAQIISHVGQGLWQHLECAVDKIRHSL